MVRAIDLQDVFSKTQAVEQLYRAMLHHPNISQRQFALHMLQMFYDDQRRPRQTTQPEGPRIHRDQEKGKERRPAEPRVHRREKQEDEEDAHRRSREERIGRHVNIVV